MTSREMSLNFVGMPGPGPLVSPLLVGRDDLLQTVGRRVTEAASGRGSTLLIAGEPGIGKSRLMASALQAARAAGFKTAKGDLGPHDELVLLSSVYDLARAMKDPRFGDLGARILGTRLTGGADSLGTRRTIVRRVPSESAPPVRRVPRIRAPRSPNRGSFIARARS